MVWKLPGLPEDQECVRIYETLARMLAQHFRSLTDFAVDWCETVKSLAEEKNIMPEMYPDSKSFLFDKKISEADRWRLAVFSLEHLVTEAGGNTAPELTCLREAALSHIVRSLRNNIEENAEFDEDNYRDEPEAVLKEQGWGSSEEYEGSDDGKEEKDKKKPFEELMETWAMCVDGRIFHDSDWQMDSMFGGKFGEGIPYYDLEPSLKTARARFPTWRSIVAKANEIVAFVEAEMGDGEFTVERHNEIKAAARQQRQGRARQALAPPSAKRARKNRT